MTSPRNLTMRRPTIPLLLLALPATAQFEVETPFQQALQRRYQITTMLVTAEGEVLEIKPSFSADQVAWRASEILVVDEGEVLDGKVLVTESLRGRIPVGTELEVPALAAYAEEEKRTTLGLFEDKLVISRRKPVLFLMDGPLGRRIVDQGRALVQSAGGARGVQRFEEDMAPLRLDVGEGREHYWPCDLFGAWATSIAWIEGEELFANVQLMNPGPAKVSAQEGGSAGLRNLVRSYDSVHAGVQRALTEVDPALRARALGEGLRGDGDNYWLRVDLTAALVLCGEAAVPVLEPLLEDTRMVASVSHALADIGGDEAKRALVDALESEVRWWRNPGLAPEPDAGQRMRTLRDRQNGVTSIVESLRRLGRSGRGKGLLHELIERIEAHPDLSPEHGERLRRSLGHL